MAEPLDPDFAGQYRRMAEPELLTFAASYDSLIDSAQTALRAEFAARNLPPPYHVEDRAEDRNLETIARYRDLSEAIVARTVLESAGIFCFLRDENLIRLDWQLSNFIGGLALQVAAEDRAAAEQLLSQPIPETIPFEGNAATGEAAQNEEVFAQPHCPRCASLDITFEGSDRKAAIASLHLLSLPLPLGAVSWRCNTCGCHWQQDDDALPQRDAIA